MSKKEKITVALYLRTATKDELQLKKQEERLEKYCEQKNYQICKFTDFGYSGIDMNRTVAFQNMRERISQCEFKKVIVYDISRIGRRTVDIMTFLNELQFYNCELESLKEEFNSTSPVGKSLISILTIFNKFEKEEVIVND